ncbi:MAG: hypothetical protein JWQ10_3360 [Herbaspirillum sp.]|jgi:hypothetical protein|nr:hypothetical protein [Herbaspirillum sp.]
MVGDRFKGASNYRIIRSHVLAKSNPYRSTVMDERPSRLTGRPRGYVETKSSFRSIRTFAVGQRPTIKRHSLGPMVGRSDGGVVQSIDAHHIVRDLTFELATARNKAGGRETKHTCYLI